jgi:TonB family protein
MKYIFSLLMLTSPIVFANVPAKPTEVKVIDTVVNAKPIKRVEPRYPVSAARNGQEGWVKLSFVIDPEGNVLDPIIEDSTGVKSLEKAAQRAIEKWKYEPATRNGEAIEQCQMTLQLDFRLTGDSTGVREKFLRHYNRVSEALLEKDYPLAEQALINLSSKNIWNMAENTWFWMIDASYAEAIGDKSREQTSIRRAIGGSKIFGAEVSANLHFRLFVLELEGSYYAKALDTFERLTEVENSQETVNKLTPYVTKIQSILDSDALLMVAAAIDNEGIWFHQLSRNSFSLADIQGELDEVEIRCVNKRTRTTFAKDTDWTIPASWGQCTVFVKGDVDSQFTLVELPNEI